MIKINRHIISLIGLLAIVGLLGSLTHYHNETLECLNHVDEQHYVQNDILCPVCTIVTNQPGSTAPDYHTDLIFAHFVEEVNEIYLSPVAYYLEPGRAPPFMA